LSTGYRYACSHLYSSCAFRSLSVQIYRAEAKAWTCASYPVSYLCDFPLKVILCPNTGMHLDVLLPNKQSLDTCSSHTSPYGVIRHSPVGQAGAEDCMEKRRDEDQSNVAGTGRFSPVSRLYCLVSNKLGPAIYLGHFWCSVREALHRAYPGTSFEYKPFIIKVVKVLSRDESNSIDIARTVLLQVGLRRRSSLEPKARMASPAFSTIWRYCADPPLLPMSSIGKARIFQENVCRPLLL
jgi:hypothetical protein